MGDRFIAVILNRWYAFAVFITACTSGFIWYVYPASPWWSILPTGVVILLLALTRDHPRRTIPWVVHISLILFMLTAGVNVWTAYNPDFAVDKFRNLLAAVFLFYAIAYQPKENTLGVLSALGIIGSILSTYFILTNDWQAHAVDTGLVNKIGSAWMALRPEIPLPSMVDDIAGGILAILTPVLAALLFCVIQRKKAPGIILSLLATLILLIGLFLTGLRAAWGGLAAGIILATIVVVVQKVAGNFSSRALLVFAAAVVLLVIGGIVIAIGVISGEVIPGVQSYSFFREIQSRTYLYRDALELAGSYYWIGGGLGSFPGLYSRYVRSIPDFYIAYSHNMYLDLLIEQGIIGLLAFVTLAITCLWLLVSRRYYFFREVGKQDYLAYFILISVITMLTQGVLENSLYGVRSTPFLFLIPGLVFFILEPERRAELSEITAIIPAARQTRRVFGVTSGVALILLLIFFHQPIIAGWYANLGSIELSKIELMEWPESRTESQIYMDGSLDRPIYYFHTALSYESHNRTANYHLGRIAMEQRNFREAIIYLERALVHARQYHGIRKNLGYCYVFNGQINAARQVLSGVSEADYDMEIYQWWWGTQGRDDLALYARRFVDSEY